MTDANNSLFISILISVVVAVLTHNLIKPFVRATLVAGIVSTILFQVYVYSLERSVDKFILIAVIMNFIVATAAAFVVGKSFKK